MVGMYGSGSVSEFNALSLGKLKLALLAIRRNGMSILQIVRHTDTSFGIAQGIGRQ